MCLLLQGADPPDSTADCKLLLSRIGATGRINTTSLQSAMRNLTLYTFCSCDQRSTLFWSPAPSSCRRGSQTPDIVNCSHDENATGTRGNQCFWPTLKGSLQLLVAYDKIYEQKTRNHQDRSPWSKTADMHVQPACAA